MSSEELHDRASGCPVSNLICALFGAFGSYCNFVGQRQQTCKYDSESVAS